MTTPADERMPVRVASAAAAFLAGAAAAGIAGAGAVLLSAPDRAILDYPEWDGALHAVPGIGWAALPIGAGLAVATAAWARRRGVSLDWVAGFLGTACLAATVSVWNAMEAFESDRVRERLQERQELAASAAGHVMGEMLAAYDRMAARGLAQDLAAWRRDATAYRVDLRGTVALAACLPDGTVRDAVPEDSAAPMRTPPVQAAIAAAAAAGQRGMATLVPLAADRGHPRLVAVARCDDDAVLACLMDPQEALAPVMAAVAPGCAIELTAGDAPAAVAGATDTAAAPIFLREVEGPRLAAGIAPARLDVARQAWQASVRPSRAWLDAQHDRANTVVLALGTMLAATVAMLVSSIARAARATSTACTMATAARAGEARMRIAERGREAIAHESAHVLRARIRETARALDAATDARTTEDVRRDALRRVGASLAHAEAEIAALLEPPPHSRVTRLAAEDDFLPHYAGAVLDFEDGPTIHLVRPVPAGALAAVQHDLGTEAFAIVTSDNPMSALAPAETNELRRGVLALELRTAGAAHRPVTGRSPDGAWSEHSFAAAIGPVEAEALAQLHGQRAYFWFDGRQFVVHEVVGARRTVALPPAPAPGGRA